MYRTHITRTVGRAFVYVCIVPSIKYFPKCNDIKAGKSHIQYRTVLQRQTQNSSNDISDSTIRWIPSRESDHLSS